MYLTFTLQNAESQKLEELRELKELRPICESTDLVQADPLFSEKFVSAGKNTDHDPHFADKKRNGAAVWICLKPGG